MAQVGGKDGLYKADPDAPHSATVNGRELRQLVVRAENLAAERKDAAEAERDFYADVKSRGFCSKTLKAIVRYRGRNPDDVANEQAMFDLYLGAIGDGPLFDQALEQDQAAAAARAFDDKAARIVQRGPLAVEATRAAVEILSDVKRRREAAAAEQAGLTQLAERQAAKASGANPSKAKPVFKRGQSRPARRSMPEGAQAS